MSESHSQRVYAMVGTSKSLAAESRAKYTIPLLFRHTHYVNNTEDYKQYADPSEIAG